MPHDPVTMAKLQHEGQKLGVEIMEAIAEYDRRRPRSQQSEARVLGPSEVGHCREYVRATIAGDPKSPPTKVKWPAFIGTVLGDGIETVLKEILGFGTQEKLTCTLPSGIKVVGSSDGRRDRSLILDLKSKDGLVVIKNDGPSLKELIQLSVYLIGALQMGMVDETALASLVYYDRSGATKEMWVYTIDVTLAREFLEMADERLVDVQNALASGTSQGHLRDMPESWCYYVECPFYKACWPEGAYAPTNKIEHEMHVKAVMQYVQGRDMAKAGASMQRVAKTTLNPDPTDEHARVSGVAPDGTVLKWTDYEGRGGEILQRIDVR
jgi:hypothetical protein